MGKKIINRLLESQDSAVKLKTYLKLLDYTYDTKEVITICRSIKEKSTTISNIFSYLPKNEKDSASHVYTKWSGVHWLLVHLADIGYPLGDNELIESRNRELQWVIRDEYWDQRNLLNGLKRFCASIDGNALFSILSLGIEIEQSDKLAERLIKYQWPDGGWNCDKKPSARNSSYNESLIPLRALNLYAKTKSRSDIQLIIEKASELFLKRRLFKKLSNNEIINSNWLLLKYPFFWHYDILFALKVLAEVGKITDPRCQEALDIIESKRLPDGGFPLEAKYYQNASVEKRYFSPVNWGNVNKKIMNEWVTIDALFALKKAKRIDIIF